MNDGRKLITELLKLTSGIEPDVLNCLLLLQSIGQASDLERPEEDAQTSDREESLWARVVQAASRPDSRILTTIADAVAQIKDKWFLPQNMIDRLCAAEADEYTLRELLYRLSKLSTDHDLLSWLFEENMARKVWSSSPLSGDFYTPQQMVRWMIELVGIKQRGSVYDPCCGSGAMLCGAALAYPDQDLRLYGQTMDSEAFTLCHMNLMLRGLSADLGQCPANTLQKDVHAGQRFDYILSNPPFHCADWDENNATYRDARWKYGYPPQKNADFAWIQHIISHLSPNGCAVTILPNSTLTTQNRAEREIRKRILLDGWLEAVIALPPGLFRNTKIPCCIWVLRHSSLRDGVLFVDARQMNLFHEADRKSVVNLLLRYRSGEKPEKTEWCAAATGAEIARKDDILSPNLYTCTKELLLPAYEEISKDFNAQTDALCAWLPDTALCEQLQTWKRMSGPTNWSKECLSQRYHSFGGVRTEKINFGKGMPMVDVKTVIHSMFLPDTFSSRVEVSKEDAEKYNIRRGDVLLNRTSETIDELACCSVALKDQTAVYGAFIKRLRPAKADWIDPRYLAGYFRSEIYRREIERVAYVYTTRANINLEQLAQIRLYYPDMTWQHAIGETLLSVLQWKRKCHDGELERLIDQFVERFLEKFITYPIWLLQKGCDRR